MPAVRINRRSAKRGPCAIFAAVCPEFTDGRAASVAGLIKVKDTIKEGAKIVCILTGNGLKDPDNAIKYSNADVKKTSTDLTEILKVMNIM